MACERGSQESIGVLICEMNVDVKLLNKFGLTAFDVCKTNLLRVKMLDAWRKRGEQTELVFSEQMGFVLQVLVHGLLKICLDPSLIETL